MPRIRNDIGHEDRESLRLASLALDAAWDTIIMHTAAGELLYFNAAAASTLGMTREEFGELPAWGWAGPVDEHARGRRLEQLERLGAVSFISHSFTKDGREVMFEVNSRWLDTPEGPRIVSVARDVTDKMHAHDLLREMAFHDPLTALPNRALLDDRLDVAISEARRHNDVLGVAFFDIDNFKPVNDTFGHDVGDRALEVIGHRLAQCVRSNDTIARIGGDEFVGVFSRLKDRADLDAAAEKVLEAIRQPIEVDEFRVVLEASCGLALFDPADDDARSLLMKADLAMYEAKGTGQPIFRDSLDGQRLTRPFWSAPRCDITIQDDE